MTDPTPKRRIRSLEALRVQSARKPRPPSGLLIACLLVGCFGLGFSGLASAGELIVTGLTGLPRANGVSLIMHDRLAERVEPIEIETNRISSVSLMYGNAIALQLGPSSRMRVSPATEQRGALIELVRGELRSVTQRERAQKRPEVHTPAAVIRPSTTTLHLFVDGVSGDTDVTSLESRAWIVSTNPVHKQSSILNTGQQITIRTGSAPGKIRKYIPDPRGDITGFLSGNKLRDAALEHDMTREGVIALNQIASADVPDTSLPSVASPFPTPQGLGWLDRVAQRAPTCSIPTMCDRIDGFPDEFPPPPPVCPPGVPPSEGCVRPR